MSEREDYADRPFGSFRERSGCVVAFFRNWRERLPAFSFGFAAGLAVGIVLYLEVGAGTSTSPTGAGRGSRSACSGPSFTGLCTRTKRPPRWFGAAWRR